MILRTEFVEHIPEKVENGVLFISMTHTVAIHRCACGCGEEVITPLHPKSGWVLTFDGQVVSLRPSIGNWNFPCKSHYFITGSTIQWCPRWMDRHRSNMQESVRLMDSKETTQNDQSKRWKWRIWKIRKKKK
jgi:hypothetical protein